MRIEGVDKTTLQQAVKNGADASVATMSPERTARLVGTVSFFGKSAEIAVLATLQLEKGSARSCRSTRGCPTAPACPSRAGAAADPRPLPRAAGHRRPAAGRHADTFQAKDGTLQISGRARNLTLD